MNKEIVTDGLLVAAVLAFAASIVCVVAIGSAIEALLCMAWACFFVMLIAVVQQA